MSGCHGNEVSNQPSLESITDYYLALAGNRYPQHEEPRSAYLEAQDLLPLRSNGVIVSARPATSTTKISTGEKNKDDSDAHSVGNLRNGVIKVLDEILYILNDEDFDSFGSESVGM